jgi:hypothetical protein
VEIFREETGEDNLTRSFIIFPGSSIQARRDEKGTQHAKADITIFQSECLRGRDHLGNAGL